MSKNNEYIYGIHAVQQVIKYDCGRIIEAWILEERQEKRFKIITEQLQQQSLPILTVPKKTLDNLTNKSKHQGIVIRCKPAKILIENDLSNLVENAGKSALFLILDGIQDPHNLGACLRTADAAGVNAVIIPKNRAADVNPTVRKVASGAAETIPVIQVTNLARTLESLKSAGIWVIGTAGEAKETLFKADLNQPLAIVLGSEEAGLRQLTRKVCDELVHIPMLGEISSLNVSVAAGVSLFEAVRQRNY
jgi:23S rRNA (guanosine2251-2'-O)-methyltransferase